MNWARPEDEDFKEAKDESSASTAGKLFYEIKYVLEFDEFGENNDVEAQFNPDELVDPAHVVDKIGDILDCYHGSGKVVKEILKVGQGIDKPKLGSLCRIKYIAYFFDKEMFDKTIED